MKMILPDIYLLFKLYILFIIYNLIMSQEVKPINFDPYTCTKHCPGGLHRRASGKLTYPSTQTGFPFSGNWNNLGSSISGVMRCVNKIQNVRRGSLETIIYEQKNINNIGRSIGGIGGLGRAPRNTF